MNGSVIECRPVSIDPGAQEQRTLCNHEGAESSGGARVRSRRSIKIKLKEPQYGQLRGAGLAEDWLGARNDGSPGCAASPSWARASAIFSARFRFPRRP